MNIDISQVQRSNQINTVLLEDESFELTLSIPNVNRVPELASKLFPFLVYFLNTFSNNVEVTTTQNNKKCLILGPYTRVRECDLGGSCSICLGEYKIGEGKRDLPCGHRFHKKCVDRWINKHDGKNCPVCRAENIFS